MTINLHNDTADVVECFGVVIKYYEGYMCSCVAENDGHFDPRDDCLAGIRYKLPVEYKIQRTAVNFKRLAEDVATKMQGGSTMTIPLTQEYHHAAIKGIPDLSDGVDLTGAYLINVLVDSSVIASATEIDISAFVGDIVDVKIYEIIQALNSTAFGEIAYEGDEDGNPRGFGHVVIRSLTHESNGSQITLLVPSGTDGTPKIFGVAQSQMPYTVIPSDVREYLPIHLTIGNNDVVVMTDRIQREREILVRGIRDTIKNFDINKMLTVSKKGTVYLQGKDYTLSTDEIVWSGGDAPATKDKYSAEYLFNTNYVAFDEAPMSRGSDDDQVSKRILLKLRNFVEAEPNIPIDNY